MATIDLWGGIDLGRVSPALNACWRRYMADRPSNANNLTFARENVEKFEALDERAPIER